MCNRRDRKENGVTKDHKDTNAVENYNKLDMVIAMVFYWKKPIHNVMYQLQPRSQGITIKFGRTEKN
jgi:hypothetical protein